MKPHGKIRDTVLTHVGGDHHGSVRVLLNGDLATILVPASIRHMIKPKRLPGFVRIHRAWADAGRGFQSIQVIVNRGEARYK